MCMIDGCERPDVYSYEYREARKKHRCGECHREIEPGERYRLDNSLYDGCWSANRTCQHCEVARLWLVENCGGWVFDMMCEDLQEHASEYPALAFGILRVVAGMRRGWKRLRGPGLLPVPAMPRSIKSFVGAR